MRAGKWAEQMLAIGKIHSNMLGEKNNDAPEWMSEGEEEEIRIESVKQARDDSDPVKEKKVEA